MAPDLFRDERLNDPELRRLEQLLEIDAVPEWGAERRRAAQLRVETDDGLVFEESVDALPGNPEQPLTEDEVVEKFVRYGDSFLDRGAAERFCWTVLHAPNDTDFAELWRGHMG